MCLAIYQPVGVKIARDRLSNGWDNNPDGGGYAYIDETGEIRGRHFLTWFDFIEGYDRDHRNNTRSPFIIHERFATHGTKDEDNIHPFKVDEHTVLIHNGILDVNMKTDKRSDTRTFAEDYLRKLPMGWMDDPDMIHLVEKFIGRGNKLVILTSDPYANHQVYIINETAGHWDRGAWWSNDGYKPRLYSTKWQTYDRNKKKGAGSVTLARPTTPAGSQIVHSVSAGGLVDGGSTDETAWDFGADWTDEQWQEYIEKKYPSICWLCGEKVPNDTTPVCFYCEWCNEHDQEWWTCGHMEDVEIVREYVRYYTGLSDEQRDLHDAFVLEMTENALEVVDDPSTIQAIEAAVKRA